MNGGEVVANKASTLLDLGTENVKRAAEILDSLYALEEKLFGGEQAGIQRAPVGPSVRDREVYLSDLLCEIRDKTHQLHRGVGADDRVQPARLR